MTFPSDVDIYMYISNVKISYDQCFSHSDDSISRYDIEACG